MFETDLNTFRLDEPFDVVFSTGALHCCEPSLRDAIFRDDQAHTTPADFTSSRCCGEAVRRSGTDRDPNSHPWRSGDLLHYYADWGGRVDNRGGF